MKYDNTWLVILDFKECVPEIVEVSKAEGTVPVVVGHLGPVSLENK